MTHTTFGQLPQLMLIHNCNKVLWGKLLRYYIEQDRRLGRTNKLQSIQDFRYLTCSAKATISNTILNLNLTKEGEVFWRGIEEIYKSKYSI